MAERQATDSARGQRAAVIAGLLGLVPAVRGALLLALGLLSMVASFSSFSGVTVVLLPATLAIFVASVKSIRVADHAVGRAAPPLLAGLVGVAVIGLSFYALFGLQADEARCWALTRGGEWSGGVACSP